MGWESSVLECLVLYKDKDYFYDQNTLFQTSLSTVDLPFVDLKATIIT